MPTVTDPKPRTSGSTSYIVCDIQGRQCLAPQSQPNNMDFTFLVKLDPSSGQEFYVNVNTKVKSWELPDPDKEVASTPLHENGMKAMSPPQTVKVFGTVYELVQSDGDVRYVPQGLPFEPVLVHCWRPFFDSIEGRFFYDNCDSGKRVKRMPPVWNYCDAVRQLYEHYDIMGSYVDVLRHHCGDERQLVESLSIDYGPMPLGSDEVMEVAECYFKRYDATMLGEVDTLLNQWRGNEVGFLEALQKEYGTRPRTLRERVRAVYAQYFPAELISCDEQVDVYKERDTELLSVLQQKFGQELIKEDDMPEDIKQRIHCQFLKYDPERANNVENVLTKHKGAEVQLLELLVCHYGPEVGVEERRQLLKPYSSTMADGVATDGSVERSLRNDGNERPMEEATTGEAVTEEATRGKAVTEEVTTGKAVTEEATGGKAVTEEATIGKVVTEEVTTGKAVTEEATIGKAVTEEATIGKAVTEEATGGRAVTEEATTGKAVTEEVTTGKAVTEEATIGKAVTEEATGGKAVTEEATGGKAVTEEATIGKAVTEEATGGKAVTEEATIGKAVTEEATGGKAVTGEVASAGEGRNIQSHTDNEVRSENAGEKTAASEGLPLPSVMVEEYVPAVPCTTPIGDNLLKEHVTAECSNAEEPLLVTSTGKQSKATASCDRAVKTPESMHWALRDVSSLPSLSFPNTGVTWINRAEMLELERKLREQEFQKQQQRIALEEEKLARDLEAHRRLAALENEERWRAETTRITEVAQNAAVEAVHQVARLQQLRDDESASKEQSQAIGAVTSANEALISQLRHMEAQLRDAFALAESSSQEKEKLRDANSRLLSKFVEMQRQNDLELQGMRIHLDDMRVQIATMISEYEVKMLHLKRQGETTISNMARELESERDNVVQVKLAHETTKTEMQTTVTALQQHVRTLLEERELAEAKFMSHDAVLRERTKELEELYAAIERQRATRREVASQTEESEVSVAPPARDVSKKEDPVLTQSVSLPTHHSHSANLPVKMLYLREAYRESRRAVAELLTVKQKLTTECEKGRGINEMLRQKVKLLEATVEKLELRQLAVPDIPLCVGEQDVVMVNLREDLLKRGEQLLEADAESAQLKREIRDLRTLLAIYMSNARKI